MGRRCIARALCILLCLALPMGPAYAAEGGAVLEVCRPLLPAGEMGADIRDYLLGVEGFLPAEARYSAALTSEGDAWQVMTLSLETEGLPLPLLRIRFSREREELRLPDAYIRTALEDTRYLEALCRLRALGIPGEVDWYGQHMTLGGLLSVLVQSYEALAGSEISTEGLAAWKDAPGMAQKALVMGLLQQADAWQPETQPELMQRADLLLRWSQAAVENIAHKGASPVLCEEAEQDFAQVMGMLSDFSVTVEEQPQQLLTREAYARMAVPVFLQHFGAQVKLEDLWLPVYADTDDPVLREAGALLLLHPYYHPDSETSAFDAAQPMTSWEFFEALQQLVALTGGTPETAEALTWGVWLPRFAPILDRITQLCQAPQETKSVENDRPYPWYLRQEETGPHSINNCMPAATAMALRWVYPDNRATVEEMRALLPMGGEGWYPEQVSEILERYQVDFDTPPIALDTMVSALDAGHILLALVNEGAYGHCLIVKGYERQGEGLWFTTYDSTSPRQDLYGDWIGENRRVEAGALLRAMKNHWWQYFDIRGAGVD